MFKELISLRGSEATPWLDKIASGVPVISIVRAMLEEGWMESEYEAFEDSPLLTALPADEFDEVKWVRDFALIFNHRDWRVSVVARVYPVVGVFDNGGKTLDRYRISLAEGGYFLSERGGPQGVFIFDEDAHGDECRDGERRITFAELPQDVRSRLLAAHVIPKEEESYVVA